MAMPGRTYAAPGSLDDKYRYSHNGQEKDNEIFIGALSAEFWEYDSRTGRRWENDPLTYPWQSPYATFNNNPIYFADPAGLEGEGGGDSGGDKEKGGGDKEGAKDKNKGDNQDANKKKTPAEQEMERENNVCGCEMYKLDGKGGIVMGDGHKTTTSPDAKTNPENKTGSNAPPPDDKNKNPDPQTNDNSNNPSKISKIVTTIGNISSVVGMTRDIYYEGKFKPNYYRINRGNEIFQWAEGKTRGPIYNRGPILFTNNSRVIVNDPQVLSKVSSGSKLVRLGQVLNVAGVVFSLYQIADDVVTKHSVQPMSVVDLGMSGVAFVPGVGWVLSGGYFILKAAGAFDKLGPTQPKMYYNNSINGLFILPQDNTRIIKKRN